MADKKICPICNKRRAERYCPAKGEKICAIDCGTEREVTIDCPSDCAYLVAAHRWEQSHPKPLAEGDVPFPDVSFPSDLIHTRQAVLSGLGYTVLIYAADQRSLADSDVFAAVQAMAETRRTLLSGIYYEKPPEIPGSRGALRRAREVHRGRKETCGGASGVSGIEGHGNFPPSGVLSAIRALALQRAAAHARVHRVSAIAVSGRSRRYQGRAAHYSAVGFSRTGFSLSVFLNWQNQNLTG